MENVPFVKMSGSGNDFIIIDNRSGRWDGIKKPEFVQAVCRRGIAVGADGLIFIESSRTSDFCWRFFNADGSEAEMCGNGGRCAARFAVLQGFAGPELSFETLAGVIHARVNGSQVRIQLPMPNALELDIDLDIDGQARRVHSINTGVPHVVQFAEDLEAVPIRELGRAIRFHPRFQPAGTNVNFVALGPDSVLQIRTYERGVEDETYACGTGSVAAALVAVTLGKAASPVVVKTRSGAILTIETQQKAPPFQQVFLSGEARVVYCGELWEEACI